MPSTVVELVIEPSALSPNFPPPTCCHLANESAVPSKSFLYPSSWPGLPMPDCLAAR